MTRFWILAAAICSAITSHAATAPVGSKESGAAKAVVCQACHGANGNSTNPEWPSLASLGADYIAEQLQNFKDGKRANPIMAPMAAPLSAQDMADLAAYFDSLPNTGLEADPSLRQAGEKLYRGGDKARGIPACTACHGPTGRGNEPAKFPALRGEQSVYTARQLDNYATGARPPGPGGIMPAIAKRLTAEDIRNVSSYVQGLR
ncbi:MAG TPA: c-type cytochrome [Steroidobacteraceae bacterium]|nr:c-type cytochrome [Steroidobacteraceae bacterium]